MALSAHARRALASMMGSWTAGDAVADVIDADGGTLNAAVRERLIQSVGNRNAGGQIADAIDADGALSDFESHYLRQALGSSAAFAEIDAEQGS